MKLTHTLDSQKLVEFAQKYPGWNGYAKDARTRKAVERALILNRIEINEFRQFRIK